MSDDLIKSLQHEVTRLNTELANTRAEAKKYRLARKQAAADYDEAAKIVAELEADRDSWKGKAEASPGEQAAELAALKSAVKARDVRDKFREAGLELNDKVTLDHLFKLNDFDPAAAEPDSLNVSELVKGWRESSPSLFKPGAATAPDAPGGATRPRLTTELPAGRGGPDTSPGRVTFRREEVRSAGWEARRPELAAAIKAGTATVVD